MPERTPEEVTRIIRENVGLAVGFDFEVTAIDDDRVQLHIPFAPEMTRLGGTISGPVMMLAADTAMYAAVLAVAENGEFAVTSHMNIDFLRRPPANGLQVTARVLRAGRRSINCAVEIASDADDRLVAHVTGAYVLFDSATLDSQPG